MSVRCENCNTPSDYRRLSADDLEQDGAKMEVRKCACGRTKHETYWVRVMEVERKDGQVVDQKIYNYGR